MVMDTHYLVQARRAEPGPVQDPRHRWIMNTLPVTVKLFVVPAAIGNGGLDWNAWKLLSATGISRTSVTLDIHSIVDLDPHHLYTSQSASFK